MSKDKNLIIVSDKNTLEYANYLIQLIGDRFSSAVFTEKHYIDSQSKIKSSTCVVFLGEGNAASSQKGTMKKMFDQFSMCYYALGKRAVMQVEKTVFDSIDYDAFVSFAEKYELSFSKPKVKLASKSLWLSPKYINPFKAKEKIYPESVYDQLFRCLIKVFYTDYLDEFVERNE